MRKLIQESILSLTVALLTLAAPADSLAGSALWKANPASGDWNSSLNWMPNTVPNGPTDIASFGSSNVTELIQSGFIELNKIAFEPGATRFQITLNLSVLNITGEGIINDSGVVQTFAETVTDATTSLLSFFNTATAGELTAVSNPGGEVTFFDASSAGGAIITSTGAGARQGHVTFLDNATAAEATVDTNGDAFTTFAGASTAGEGIFTTNDGGAIDFGSDSSATNATVHCNGGTMNARGGGGIGFNDSASAAEGHFTINGAAVAGAIAAHAIFDDATTAGDGTFIINGGAVDGAEGAFINFYEDTTAGNANLTINGGSNGGEGGSLFFFDQSTGGTASIALFDNCQTDIGNRAKPGVTIGSLEGNGLVFLGPKALTIGSNNRSTTFSGLIQDGGINQGTGGTLSKIGSGTLKLSGANTYTGGTTLSAGSLVINNTTGSGTGAGPVQVNGGTLGGSGIIAGAVTIGGGSGPGANLAPGQGASKATTLTLQSRLTWKGDGSYRYRLNTKKKKSDEVMANGVTIESGAQFNLEAIGHNRLRAGKVATVINNTSVTPIVGAFANLPEGATLSAGGNTLQVSYHGGDGNDLTLTVVP